METDVQVAETKRNGPLRQPKRTKLGKRKGERLKYKWKKKPYVHQVAAVKRLLSTGFGGALLMEPRTGKTKVVIDYASILHAAGKVNRVLVIGPISSMGVWEDQLTENCPFPYRLTIWDRKTRKATRYRRNRATNEIVVKGNKHYQELPRYGDNVLDFVLMNYDAFSTPARAQRDRVTHEIRRDEEGHIKRSQGRGGKYEVRDKILAWRPQLIVLDESHRIKSPSAAKSRMIHSLRDASEYRVIMTGTVVTKKKRLFDVYSQWLFLNKHRFEGFTFAEFKSLYGVWTHRNNYPQWRRNRNEEALHTLIHQDAFSITREECFDLPRMTQQIIHVDLEESAEVYDQMAEHMVAQIKSGEITEASIRLVQGMRLRQITSGLSKTTPSEKYPEGRLVIIGSEKLRVWRSRIEDLMEAEEKVVVGALWTGDILRLKRECQKMKIPYFIIRGGMKREEHVAAWRGFAQVSGHAVFIGQPAAASEAIDLSCASIMQWYSLTPSWVNFKQFSDRIALSDRPTFHEYFLATDTVDELLYETLLQDGDVGKAMITSPDRLLRLQELSY